jgi:hypothetical protein
MSIVLGLLDTPSYITPPTLKTCLGSAVTINEKIQHHEETKYEME